MGQDNFDEMRKAMIVSQLRTTDVSDPRVIAAMNGVAREKFVPAASRSVAYSDRGVRIGDGRSLNAPLATGRLINTAALHIEDEVLLIGAATGYTAAVIARLAGTVVAVEQSGKLAAKAKANLADYANIVVKAAPHAEGSPEEGPYSAIVIDGVVEDIPAALTDQLKPDGRIVAAILDDGVSRLAIGHRVGDAIGYQYFADCGATGLPGFEKSKSFSF